jgi:hypothetical protein
MPRKPMVVVEAEAEIRRATSIRPEAIQEEYAAVPSDVYRWARVVAQAKQAQSDAEAELENWEHASKNRVVDEAEGEDLGEGKKARPPGEDRLKSIVRGSSGYLQKKRAVAEAERVKDDALAVLEAVRKKADMLTNLGVTQRQEVEMAVRDGVSIKDRRGTRA